MSRRSRSARRSRGKSVRILLEIAVDAINTTSKTATTDGIFFDLDDVFGDDG